MLDQDMPLNLITLPLWWYTVGLSVVWHWAQRSFQYGLRKTALKLFLRHLAHPLYGDYTRSGRIISLFLRLVLLVFKMFALGFRLVFLGLALAIYLLVWPVIIVMLIYQLFPV